MINVRDRIVDRRRERVANEGATLGTRVPDHRTAPVVPFLSEPRVICEIKRRSPSRGAIAVNLDPVDRAGRYVSAGIRSISVLTEEDHFGGSLADLMAVKRSFPQVAVLRKDFLLDEEDIDISYRAGADAVLLIASILNDERLAQLYAAATKIGMAALVELHEAADFDKARSFAPGLIGINARDLSTFDVDLLTPIRLHPQVDWPHRAVFESGVFTEEDAVLVRSSGFDGVLVGEAAVRDDKAIPGIISGMRITTGTQRAPAESASLGRSPAQAVHPRAGFWAQLMTRRRPGRPLVKICGITNRGDAELATNLGADILGFVLAESPRQADLGVVRDLADLPTLKVAVVVSGGAHGKLPGEVAALLADGIIDAIQFHGDEEPEECFAQAFPYFKALRVPDPRLQTYGCPRVLVDARNESGYGGTGRRIAPDVVAEAMQHGPLWLAGGLSHENIAQAIADFQPELVDASSGLESQPGRKDSEKLTRFFEEIDRASL